MSNLHAEPSNNTEVEHWNYKMADTVNKFSGVAQVVEKVS
jgi:hypothetical protein